MSEFVLGKDGIREPQSVDLKEGHTYYMGASDHPDLIYIDEVKSDKVVFRRDPFYKENQQTDRRSIIEDLVVEGGKAHAKSREQMKDMYDDYEDAVPDYHDRDTDLKEIQKRKIIFKVKEDFAEGKERREITHLIEEKYYHEYGLETNMGVGDLKFETIVKWGKVSEIRELPEIRVLKSEKPDR